MSNLLRRNFQSVLVTALLMTVMLASAITQAQAATCGADPTVSFTSTAKDVLPDGSVDYAVSITNVTGAVCNFTLVTSGDSAGCHFQNPHERQ